MLGMGRIAAGLLVAALSPWADDPHEIAAQLTPEIEEYTAQSEGEITGDPAAMLAMDPAVLPEVSAGYGRIFVSDRWDGHTATVVGIDITGLDPAAVLDELAAVADPTRPPVQMWVDADPPLDGLVIYSTRVPGSQQDTVPLEVTAFVADDLLIVIEVVGGINATATTRRATEAQVELTPPTVTPGYDPPPRRKPPAPPDDPDPEVTESNDEDLSTGNRDDGDRATPLAFLGVLAVPAAVGLVAWQRGARSSRRKRIRQFPSPPVYLAGAPPAGPTPPPPPPPPPAGDWQRPT